jgi:hypothetical protein
MAVQHIRPCKDCPWRRVAAPGWLGAVQTPESWVATAKSDDPVPCHTGSGQCAGIAIFRANIYKLPRFKEVLRLPPNKDLVFGNGEEFIKYHRKFGFTSAKLDKGGGKLWKGKR